jgi:hypothetical protein
MEAMAAGAGSDWQADVERGWFELEHAAGVAIIGPFGTVPGATVFLFASGGDGAPVEAVVEALFGL